MSKKSNILLIGSGGIGTIAALNLEQGGLCNVTAVLRSNYTKVNESGFTIESCDHGNFESWKPSQSTSSPPLLRLPYPPTPPFTNSLPSAVLPSIPDVSTSSSTPYDYIIVSTKNLTDIPPSLATLITPAVTPGFTTILLLQNGLNIQHPYQTTFPTNTILSGVSLCGANEISSGTIQQNDHDRLIIGAFPNPPQGQNKGQDEGRGGDQAALTDDSAEVSAAKHFVSLYAASGRATATYDPDVSFVRWRKLMYNAVWNPICALTNLDTTRLRLTSATHSSHEDPFSPINTLVRPAMNEIIHAAKICANVDLPASLVEEMIEADPLESFLQPSMMQDVRRGRYMEVESILGEVVREADRCGMAPQEVGTVRTLYGLCRSVQWRTREGNGMIGGNVEELVGGYSGC